MDPVISSKTLSRCKCLIGVQLAIIAAAIFVLHREKVIFFNFKMSRLSRSHNSVQKKYSNFEF